MAREIEIKIPLTDDEYKSIYDAIYSKTTFDGLFGVALYICPNKSR